MAGIRTRTRSDGTVGYTVYWRLGGTRAGAQQSETFDSRQEARDFALDVEAAGHQWPAGWVRGVGYVRLADEPAAAPEPHRLLDFGREFVAQRTGIGPDTRSDYLSQVQRLDGWLTSLFGAAPLVEHLSADDVRRLVNAREAAGAAPKTISNYHGLLSAIMGYAVERNLRADNPCRGARLPKSTGLVDEDGSETITFLTESEFDLIHRCLAFDPAAQDVILVVVGTGLRWGEVSALQVRDLELDAPMPYLTVRRAWKHNGRGEHARAGAGRRYLGMPKSKKGRRRITCSPTVVAALRRAAAGKAPTDFVFTAHRGGPLNHMHFTDRRWRKAVTEARAKGLSKSPRFHDLRHTHAAWLISAGVPLPVIQRRLGHESIKTTVDVYGGLLDQAHEAAGAAIEAALHGKVPPPATPPLSAA
ncbi:MAG TPA: site-specific integrase [Mycobacteriales bacterium]|jgi:integrase|nr:site-specific integrase [Mycobacteriales bacterium]